MGLFSGLKRAYAKHGAAGFAIAAGIGVVVEGVLAYRAGKRCGQHPEWTDKEKAKNVIAPIGTGIATVTCIGASQHKNAGQIATLMSTQLLNEKNRNKWMNAAEKTIGKENLEKIKESMHPVKDEEVKPRVDGKMLVIDGYSGARGYGTLEEIWEGINKFQNVYHTDGYVPYGKLLEFCHLERIDGETRILPFGETDDEGVDLMGLSDMDIGYSSWYLGEMGYETDWIDIVPRIHTHADGSEYIVIEEDRAPIAQYESY